MKKKIPLTDKDIYTPRNNSKIKIKDVVRFLTILRKENKDISKIPKERIEELRKKNLL